MKKTIFPFIPFVLVVALLTSSAFTLQDGVTFKAAYKENTTYVTVMDIVSSGTMKFDFTKEQEEQLLQQGMTNPMDIEQKMQTTTSITTSKRNADSTMSFVGTTKHGNSVQKIGGVVQPMGPELTNDIVMYGTISNENVLVLDSLSNHNLGDQFVEVLAESLKASQNHIEFPKNELKIGDSFEQSVPFAIPLPGANTSDIQIVMKYKLTKIEGDLAYFDIKQALSMNMDGELNLSINAKGTGTCVYSTSKSFVTEVISNLDMKMKMKMMGQNIEADMVMNQLSKTTITPVE